MACFADIYVSQGSVATYARGGWILDNFSEFFLNRWIFGKVTNKSVFNYKLCKSLSSTSSFAVLLSSLTWSSRRSLSCSTELAVVGGWREPWRGLDLDTETSSRPTSRPTAFRSASSGVFDSGEECSDSDDRSDRQSTGRPLAPRSKFAEVSGSKGHEPGRATLVDLVMMMMMHYG